jgi:hypothetical protein
LEIRLGINIFKYNWVEYCDSYNRLGVAGFEQAGVLARLQGKQFLPKRCRKNTGTVVTALIAGTAWFNNAARSGSIQQKTQRTGI